MVYTGTIIDPKRYYDGCRYAVKIGNRFYYYTLPDVAAAAAKKDKNRRLYKVLPF